MRTYEPGTVAVATVLGVPNVRVMAGEGAAEPRLRWFTTDSRVSDPYNEGWFLATSVTDVRLQVVLDLDAARSCWADTSDPAAIVERLRETQSVAALAIADQIEAQTKPPKPPEPAGLGAVVEDASGERWTRIENGIHGRHWARGNAFPMAYQHIDVARVLSEGVTDAV